jgi:molybdopterin converting factor small subunit
MATVHVSNRLLEHTGGLETIEIDAPRVHELIVALVDRFPGLVGKVEEMAVAIDGEIYQEPAYQPLEPASDVHFIPRIAGG